MKEKVEQQSDDQGFRRNRLPSFSSDEIESLKNASDFLGLNYYGSYECLEAAADVPSPSHVQDIGTECFLSDDEESQSGSGLRAMLKWIQDNYENPEVIITGNGYADNVTESRDCGRVLYHNVSPFKNGNQKNRQL